MDKATFDAELATALGGNLVDVELTSTDYTYAFNVAKRTFIQKGGNNLNKLYVPLSVVANTTSYVLPADPSVDTIVRIIRPRIGLNAADPFAMSAIQEIFGATLRNGGSELLTYELISQFLEDHAMYTAFDVNFNYNKRTRTLTLLRVPDVPQTWYLDAYCDSSDDIYRDNLWIQMFARAEAKIILGRAYSKFQAISTPAGDSSISGETLIQEGKEEQLQLIEDIHNFVDGDGTGMPIIIG